MKTAGGFAVLILCAAGGAFLGGAIGGEAGFGYGALGGFFLGFWAAAAVSPRQQDEASQFLNSSANDGARRPVDKSLPTEDEIARIEALARGENEKGPRS